MGSASLLALTVRSDFARRALAAYATDSSGRLWRFDFGASLAQLPDRPPRCVRGGGRPARVEQAEAPLLYGASDGVLVVQAFGNKVQAIPDRAAGTSGKPRRIEVMESGTGVRLAGVGSADPEAGWHLTLPHAGETVEELAATGPGYLHFVTRSLDGQRRVYLMHAATGESVAATGRDGALASFLTGQRIGRDDAVVAQTTWHDSTGPQAGWTTRDTGAIALAIVGATASTTLAELPVSRRRGRLSWRELVPTGSPQP